MPVIPYLWCMKFIHLQEAMCHTLFCYNLRNGSHDNKPSFCPITNLAMNTDTMLVWSFPRSTLMIGIYMSRMCCSQVPQNHWALTEATTGKCFTPLIMQCFVLKLQYTMNLRVRHIFHCSIPIPVECSVQQCTHMQRCLASCCWFRNSIVTSPLNGHESLSSFSPYTRHTNADKCSSLDLLFGYTIRHIL